MESCGQSTSRVSLEELRSRLNEIHGKCKPDIKLDLKDKPNPLCLAATLIPITLKDGVPNVILTIRSKTVRTHPGQVSFPGGKCDPSDRDMIHTALREAQEEIGLDPAKVEVITMLPPCCVLPNYLSTSVVGLVKEDFEPMLNKNEVDEVFSLPLSRFLQDDFHVKQVQHLNNSYPIYGFMNSVNGVEVNVTGYTAYWCVITAALVYGLKYVTRATQDYDTKIELKAMIEESLLITQTLIDALTAKL